MFRTLDTQLRILFVWNWDVWNVVAVVCQSVFHVKIYQTNIFLFFKNYF
jgi:hypothetical protein